MKSGAFDAALGKMSLPEAVKYLKGLGAEMIEIGSGGYPTGCNVGSPRCDTPLLLDSDAARGEFLGIIGNGGLEISALSCHGNPIHPDEESAGMFNEAFDRSVLLAEKLEVKIVVTFSGLPGTSLLDKFPVWVTNPWPTEQLTLREWQVEQAVLYWKHATKFAADHGVKVAWELHPMMLAHNPRSFKELAERIGADNLGVNLDLSHLMWRGMNPSRVIEALAPWIMHVHGKDCLVNQNVAEVEGVIDATSFEDVADRAWRFCTMGVGHSKAEWMRWMQDLRLAGYDGTVSLEHEDALMSVQQGFEQGMNFLNKVILRDPPGENAWAK